MLIATALSEQHLSAALIATVQLRVQPQTTRSLRAPVQLVGMPANQGCITFASVWRRK